MGGTSGRTTLAGEGLQHQDGHSHLLSSTVPSCVSYDPTFAYELAVIVHAGLERMLQRREDVFYYVTMMNENYPHPALPTRDGVREGILRGMYLFEEVAPGREPRVQLLGSGAILREVIAAARLLAEDFGVGADVWSCPSFTELRRDGLDTERWNLLHPGETPRASWVERMLQPRDGPVVAASDYLKAFADQIRAFVPRRYRVLGTDGYGRSDRRERLRQFFEVNRFWIATTALAALAEEDAVPGATVRQAIERYKIDPSKPNPVTV
jgi:pyruvate dehydrogenase E1 component